MASHFGGTASYFRACIDGFASEGEQRFLPQDFLLFSSNLLFC